MKKALHNRFLIKAIGSGLLSLLVSLLAEAQPIITSYSPVSAPVSSTVTISGTGFNTTLANNVVFFGVVKATVLSVTGSTTLTVQVPYGANYQHISVTNLATNLTGYGEVPFVLTYLPNGDDSFRPVVKITANGTVSVRNLIIADMNLDGKPDLVVVDSNNDVSIFPNTTASITATVSFGTAVKLSVTGSSVSGSVAVADVDGNGKLDILAVYSGVASVSVYRNTTSIPGGTPSFATRVTFTTANTPVALAIDDLDGNGKPDVVVVCALASNNVSVLRNTSISGTISFATAQTFSAGSNPSAVAVDDLNNDGKPDVAVANAVGNSVSIFRNASSSGTVSLTTTATLTAGTTPRDIIAVDFTGDGFFELAVANGGSNNISVFKNNGLTSSISFSTAVNFTSIGRPSALCASDTDGDGDVNFVVTNSLSNTVSFLHNHSTTSTISFTITPEIASGNVTTPTAISMGDLNADSKPDLVTNSAGTSNNVAIFLQTIVQSLTITSVNTLAVGSPLSVTVSRSVSPTSLGGSLTYALAAGSGSATVNASGNLTGVSVGTVILTVTALGATDYASASTSQLVTITKTTPTLTITSSNTLNLDGTLTATVTTTATGGQGGAVTYSITAGSGSATVNSSTGLITGISIGTVTLTATSAGDTNYYSASTSQLITIGQGMQILIVMSSNTTVVDGTLTATITTTASQNIGTLIYSVNNGTGAAFIDAGTGIITALSVGTVTLTVISLGNTNYSSASVDQLITIGQATPTLTVTSANTLNVDDVITATANTTATFGRGGAITFSIVAGSGSATVDINTGALTAISVGTVTLTTSSSGDGDYYPANTSQLITIGKTTPALSITSANTLNVDGSLTATTTTSATLGCGGNSPIRLLQAAVQRRLIPLRVSLQGSASAR